MLLGRPQADRSYLRPMAVATRSELTETGNREWKVSGIQGFEVVIKDGDQTSQKTALYCTVWR